MADLIDRLSGEDQTRPKINLHRFIGVLRLYAFGEWARADIVSDFDLQGDEATQAAQLADKVDAETGVANKSLYVARVEAVAMCIEDHQDTLYHSGGLVNKTKVYEDLQIGG